MTFINNKNVTVYPQLQAISEQSSWVIAQDRKGPLSNKNGSSLFSGLKSQT